MSFWDERYETDEYLYGTEPNAWLAAQKTRLAAGGRVLCLGDGEGRNGVWLATQGFLVDTVDGSKVGAAKAERLARARGATVHITVADLADYLPREGAYDAVVLIFVHLPPGLRQEVHRKAQAALGPGGLLVIEAYHPRQLPLDSGGPKEPALLYHQAMLEADFPQLRWDELSEARVELSEGRLHQGPAEVVRGVGRKAAPVAQSPASGDSKGSSSSG